MVDPNRVKEIVFDFLERAGWSAGQVFLATLLAGGSVVAAATLPWKYAAVLALSAAPASVVLTAIQYATHLADLSRFDLGRTRTFWLDMFIRLVKTFLTSLAASIAAAHPFNVVSFDWPTALNVATLAVLGALGKGLLARGSDSGAWAAKTEASGDVMMSPSTLPTDTYAKAVGRTSLSSSSPPSKDASQGDPQPPEVRHAVTAVTAADGVEPRPTD
jgi:hypothetical protein